MPQVIQQRLARIWACPACGGQLVPAEETLSPTSQRPSAKSGQPEDRRKAAMCPRCGMSYGLIGDIPDLLPPGKRPVGESEGDTPAMAQRRDAWDRRLGERDAGLQQFIAAASGHIRLGTVVVDLGTGPGTVPMVLAWHEPAPELIVAMDISPAMVRLARQNTRSLPNVQVLRASTRRRLPLREGSCDLVLRRLAPALPEEVQRVLRPGGIYLRFTYGPDHWREVYDALPDIPRPTPRGTRQHPEREGAEFFSEVVTERQGGIQYYTIHDIVDGLEMGPAAFFFNRARDLPRLRATLPKADEQGLCAITTDFLLVTVVR